MFINASDVNRDVVIDDRSHVRRRRNVEKLLSHSQEESGIVAPILITSKRFGNRSSSITLRHFARESGRALLSTFNHLFFQALISMSSASTLTRSFAYSSSKPENVSNFNSMAHRTDGTRKRNLEAVIDILLNRNSISAIKRS